MSVLIKGVVMPKSCQECTMNCLRGFNGSDFLANKRADGCQLVEIKTPHGRLIDADALKEELATAGIISTYGTQIYLKIDAAKTIIEAEGGGEDG